MTQRCDSCGAPISAEQCAYCGSTTAPTKPKRRVMKSDMGNFKELRDVHLIGDMNHIGYAENCLVEGDMNHIRKHKNCEFKGDMNHH